MTDDPRDRRSPDVQLAVLSTQLGTVAIAVTRLEGAVGHLDGKVDTLDAKVQRAEGVLSLVRWLGVSGVIVALVALARSAGIAI